MRRREGNVRRGSFVAWMIPATLTALLLLSACSSGSRAGSGASSGSGGAEEDRYGIAFSTYPETLKQNESAELKVEVTKGGAPVKEAAVILELWPKDASSNSHAQMPAKADGKGNYLLKGQFSEEGTYYVIAHITPKETGQMTMAGFDFEVAP
ncbi:FixH family protein [Cohnella sp. AR92]|uniref:FixH family protein n=1 Tax=Cohnella sp. AR92 TaxID=648716 RepID=UPI000F8D4E71|nr:FixH family protein [Cohnella sp. AR92]RUS48954.1 hypothetical protein ELR57_01000 [Cohnella sp. AR92]